MSRSHLRAPTPLSLRALWSLFHGIEVHWGQIPSNRDHKALHRGTLGPQILFNRDHKRFDKNLCTFYLTRISLSFSTLTVLQGFGANRSTSLTWYNFRTGTAVSGGRLDFRFPVVQLSYWNRRLRRPAGFSFSVVQLQYWNRCLRRPAGFWFSGSTALVLEAPSPAAGWIFHSLVVQL